MTLHEQILAAMAIPTPQLVGLGVAITLVGLVMFVGLVLISDPQLLRTPQMAIPVGLCLAAGVVIATAAVELRPGWEGRVEAVVAEHVYGEYGLVGVRPGTVRDGEVRFDAADADGDLYSVRVAWEPAPLASMVDGAAVPAALDPVTVTITPKSR